LTLLQPEPPPNIVASPTPTDENVNLLGPTLKVFAIDSTVSGCDPVTLSSPTPPIPADAGAAVGLIVVATRRDSTVEVNDEPAGTHRHRRLRLRLR